MRRRTLLFDDEGATWDAQSFELRKRFHAANYCGDLPTDLIRSMGFIEVRDGPTFIRVRVRLQVVSQVALASALYWLGDIRPKTVVLEFVGEPEPVELFTTPAAAMARLGAVTSLERFLPRFASETVDPNRLAPSSPLGELMCAWHHGGRTDPEALVRVATRRLNQRFMLIKAHQEGPLVFEALGRGLHIPDPRWLEQAIGRRFEDQPDRSYWAWAEKCHRTALASPGPTVNDIDAEIYWPGNGWVRRIYRRMLLPCVTQGGDRLMFCANSTDSNIRSRMAS
jgi:hypothetical protein